MVTFISRSLTGRLRRQPAKAPLVRSRVTLSARYGEHTGASTRLSARAGLMTVTSTTRKERRQRASSFLLQMDYRLAD
jgi:hypothetical protein